MTSPTKVSPATGSPKPGITWGQDWGEGREGQKSMASPPGYASLSYSENMRKGHYSGLKGPYW